jgi:hypothetical protein
MVVAIGLTDLVPDAATVPMPWLIETVVAFVLDHVKIDAAPDVMEVGEALIVTVGSVGGAPVVVKDETLLLASALPATSFTPALPPVIVAVYVVPPASGDEGVSSPTRNVASYETVAGTRTFAALRRTNVLVVIVAGFICSLNVARTVAARLTPVTPAIGVTPVSVGGVVSDDALTVTVAVAVTEPAALVAVAV